MSKLQEDKVLDVKVVILGNTGVGKTSMVNRYVRGQFVGDVTATVGAAFTKKDLLFANTGKVCLQIWDTAGQERFRSLAPMYYRGAHAAVLVFDATSPDSLVTVDGWVEELHNNANSDILLVVACNKIDAAEERGGAETAELVKDAQTYAQEIGATLFQTSAKSGRGIEELFTFVAKALLERDQKASKAAPPAAGRVTVDAKTTVAANKKGGCC